MKTLIILSCLAILLSGCLAEEKQNPDEGFDSFYQGSPQDLAEDVEIDIEKIDAEFFEFTGGNSDWQCTINCSPR